MDKYRIYFAVTYENKEQFKKIANDINAKSKIYIGSEFDKENALWCLYSYSPDIFSMPLDELNEFKAREMPQILEINSYRVEESALSFLRSNGLLVDQIKESYKWVRCKEQTNRNKWNAAYKFFSDIDQKGQTVYICFCKNFKDSNSFKFKKWGATYELETGRELQKSDEADDIKLAEINNLAYYLNKTNLEEYRKDKEIKELRESLKQNIKRLINSFDITSNVFSENEYLNRKNILFCYSSLHVKTEADLTEDIKLNEGDLLVPTFQDLESKEIQSLQIIHPNGQKRFMKGLPTKGQSTTIKVDYKDLTDYQNAEIIFLVEGFATGHSVAKLLDYTGANKGLKYAVICCFSGSNLRDVIIKIRDKKIIFICADNDKSGAGLEYAKAAQMLKNNSFIIEVPNMKDNDNISDFNDLYSELLKNYNQNEADKILYNHFFVPITKNIEKIGGCESTHENA